jgi:hypothetical protein
VPRIGLHDVDITAGAPLALLADHVRMGQVTDRPGDRRGAHVEGLGELGGRHPPVLVGEQLGEDTAGEPGHTCVREGVAETFDVCRHRALVTLAASPC